jgi:hypothetical protein
MQAKLRIELAAVAGAGGHCATAATQRRVFFRVGHAGRLYRRHIGKSGADGHQLHEVDVHHVVIVDDRRGRTARAARVALLDELQTVA